MADRTLHGVRRSVAVTISLVGLVFMGMALQPPGTLAAGNTLSLTPATKTVPANTSLAVGVLGTSSVAVSGTSATVTFDKTLLHVASIAKGSDWTNASALWAGWPTPANMATFITAANGAGKIPLIGAALLTGSVAAGGHTLYTITFTAVAPGTANVGLPIGPVDGAMIDAGGGPLTVTTAAASACGATPSCAGVFTIGPAGSGTPEPSSSAGASHTPRPTHTPRATAPNTAIAPGAGPLDLSGQVMFGGVLLGIALGSGLLVLATALFDARRLATPRRALSTALPSQTGDDIVR